MLLDFPILTLVVLLPGIGAVFTYLTSSDKAARAVALGFSLVVLGLATVLLLGFVWPDLVSLPTFVNGGHVDYAVEKSPWASTPCLNGNYFLGAAGWSGGLGFLNALLSPPAFAVSWTEHHSVASLFAMF